MIRQIETKQMSRKGDQFHFIWRFTIILSFYVAMPSLTGQWGKLKRTLLCWDKCYCCSLLVFFTMLLESPFEPTGNKTTLRINCSFLTLIVWKRYMTVTLVYFAVVLKMSGVVKHDEICGTPEGFSSQTGDYFCFLVRALAKCDDLVLVSTGTFIKSSSWLTVCVLSVKPWGKLNQKHLR